MSNRLQSLGSINKQRSATSSPGGLKLSVLMLQGRTDLNPPVAGRPVVHSHRAIGKSIAKATAIHGAEGSHSLGEGRER